MSETNWKTSWADRRFRRLLPVSLVLLVLVLTALTFILSYAEKRSGIVIEKNWLGRFPPQDFSRIIFSATYGFALAGIILCFRRPSTGLSLIQGYTMISFLRCVTLLLVPLDPPEGIIPLADPLLQNSFYAGRVNLKDLFFSGHAATLFLFAFLLKNKSVKIVFCAAGLGVGILLALQRVHYVSDVLAAPVFAYAAWYFTQRWPAFLRY
ncbi:MAG: hypothetical protein FD123_3855 [Bacteroidetes bacterium]|nr:MAG: hypothetical protein FD123_3855 [Bacteroidota bacterium]